MNFPEISDMIFYYYFVFFFCFCWKIIDSMGNFFPLPNNNGNYNLDNKDDFIDYIRQARKSDYEKWTSIGDFFAAFGLFFD